MNIERLNKTSDFFYEMKESFDDIKDIEFIKYVLEKIGYLYNISIFYRFEYRSRCSDKYLSNIRMIKLAIYKTSKSYDEILDLLSVSLVDSNVTGKREYYVFSEHDTDVYDTFKRYDSIIEMSKFLEEKINAYEMLE